MREREREREREIKSWDMGEREKERKIYQQWIVARQVSSNNPLTQNKYTIYNIQ